MNRLTERLVGLALSLVLMGALAACQQSEPAKDGPALSSAQAAVQAAPAKPAPAKAAPPRDPWEPGVVLVRFKPGITAASADQIAGSLGLRRGKPRRATGVDHMKITTGESVPAAAARVSKDPRVVYAEPNHRIALLNTPNDPRFTECWGLDNTGQTGGTAGADIGAVEAWDISIGSANVIVAVVDTGVDYTHPDLAPNIWVNEDEIAGNGLDDDNNGYVDDVRGYDFVDAGDNDPMDEDSHGTHCSGTIGAYGNDGLGVAGVNWRVSIMPVRIIGNQELDAFCLDAAEGIRYACDNGARVLSNSWWTVRQYNQTLHDTVLWTESTGAVLVFAAGNYGEDVDDPAMNIYPASWHPANMIGVAATEHNDELVTYENTENWWASNFGATTIDVGAPGHNILSSVLGGGYELYSGTSMACPHVAGAVALMLSIRPDLDPAGVKAALFGSVDPLPSLQGITTTGGRINLYRAMAVISGMPLPPVALAGGNHTVMTGTEVVLDGSRSFDPNQDPITFAWAFYPPAWSAAALDSLTLASPRFTADVCGLYQGVLTVTDDGGLVSQPDRGRIQALNLSVLTPAVESPHPYDSDYTNEWVITQPGAVTLAAHFSLFDTESGWDFVTILDGAGTEVASYSGQRGAFDTPTITGDTMIVRFTTDSSVTYQGFTIDQVWWCDAGNCPAGQGDCNDDPADGCETDTSDDDLNCGWCAHSCAKPHAQFDCQSAICQFLACDPGWSDCDASLLNGCESDPLNDPLNCGGCGAPCAAMPHALPGCAGGQCAIVECEAGWDDCNGVLADGCETDVTADPVNCGGCGVDCMALPGVENAYCDAAQCWLGNCAAEPDLVESLHPYENQPYGDPDLTWTITRAGATRLRVHFAYVDVEVGYDFLYLEDSAGQVIETYNQREMPAFWSAWVTGDSIRIRFHADGSVTYQGFVIDQVMPCGEGACLDGFADCDGLGNTGCESEVAEDPLNCGGCGLVCTAPDHASADCQASECLPGACLAGWGDCNQDMADGCELDIASDEQNCGGCGVLCAMVHGTGECLASLCTLAACEAGYDNCDGDVLNGCEAELATDPLNCNACGTVCEALPHAATGCLAGACAMGACEAGWADCDQDPATGCEVDTGADAQNCSACGAACAFANAGASCVASACVMGACDAGFGDCDQDPATGCEVDTTLDAQHCSACGAVCAFANAGASCVASACVMGACDAGFGDCDQDPATGCEAELALDAQNCGACGTVCSFAHAAASCAANACVLGACEAGFGDCDGDAASGCEATLATDAANCGECGHACEADESCQAGGCVAGGCDAGLADCNQDPADGCEVTLATDAANCGECGHACEADESCQAGECVTGGCDAGLADCNQDPADGCEVTLATDEANCGECGHACEAGQACAAGDCQVCADADQDGFLDAACGGDDCLDTNADVNPDADEVCDNLIDDDCDGDTDDADTDCGTEEGGGCGCASSGSDTPAWAGLALVLGLIVSRRRARK